LVIFRMFRTALRRFTIARALAMDPREEFALPVERANRAGIKFRCRACCARLLFWG
jgi:hypothetical protein